MKNPLHNEEAYKLFTDTWKLLHTNQRMFEYWIKNGDFSIHERRLLKCFQLYKKNKKIECLELLDSPIHDDAFLEGVRFYLKGLVHNQHCHYFYAVENLNKAIQCFQQLNEEKFLLNCLFLISMVHGNRREIKMMAKSLDDIKEYKLETISQKLQLLYAELFFFVLSNQKDHALAIYNKASKLKYDEYKNYHPYFLVQKFMLFAKNKEYKKCYQVLDEYKEISGNVVKANYSFMKTLLDHLDKDTPLYVYARDYVDFPELYQQLEVIKCLKAGDIGSAKKYWSKLAQHNPALYEANFVFKGDENLFAQALERYKTNSQRSSISSESVQIYATNLEKLHFIFNQNPGPHSITDLIQWIWQEEISEQSLARLRKLISQYANKHSAHIKNSQATYQLVSTSKKSA